MKSHNTIAHLFQERVRQSAAEVSLYYPANGRYHPVTWQELHQMVQELALGLWALGLRHGDRLAIISNTRYEWTAVDQAGLHFGGVVVGIYPSSTPDQIHYILHHSEARVVFLEDSSQLAKLTPLLASLPHLQALILIDPSAAPSGSWLTLEELVEQGRQLAVNEPHLPARWLAEIAPDHTAAIVYTSGTTGPPKGVVLTHKNLFGVCQSVQEFLGLRGGEPSVAYLPMAHILQRVNVYLSLYINIVGYYAPDMLKVMETVQAVQPTSLSGVPRIFEKIHARVLSGVMQAPPNRQRIFHSALAAGLERSRLIQQHRPVPLGLRLRYAFYNRLVFQKLRTAVFGGNIQFATSGAAPISKEILEFFHAIGLTIAEGYGLTETSSPITLNHPQKFKFGTVGPALPGAAVKIAADGEILLKGPGVFKEYYKNPAATREAFTDDGWFRSGDIGELDPDGFLRITDRKKNIIITAGGKNIPPANIENLLMNSPYISQAMVHGDRRKYLTALITLDPEAVGNWLANQAKGAISLAEMAQDPDVLALVAETVTQVNQSLASYETIKYFRILPEELSVAADTLTPSLKLKRKQVEEKYHYLLNEMYAE